LIKILQVRNVDSFVESRRQKTSQKDRKIVLSILDDVRKNGDSAVKKYEQKFNGKKTTQLRLNKQEITQAKISIEEFNALKLSAVKLSKQQRNLKKNLVQSVKKIPNVSFVPVPTVGCYIPGGQARYPSSAIMSVITAAEAGVEKIIVVSPPDSNGKIDPMTITVAQNCGAEIYKMGGAQAIAALAYGTKSVPKVDKIVGPGGKFVSIAKAIVSEETSIDMIAGPTELGIIADTSSNPELIAYDLISQAEHSSDTMCFVITNSRNLAKKIQKSLDKIIPDIERNSIVKKSITKNGFIAICKNQNEIIELANKIAPEHMELMVKNGKALSKKITGPGLVLIGNNTPSSASDYLLGTNHILPTSGFGRVRGGLSILDFLKLQTVIQTKKSDLSNISKKLKILTDAEGLPNHYRAVERRLQ
jgi:histidinol dehydrogenase